MHFKYIQTNRDWLTINLPRPYSATICNALSASSGSVNLRNLGGGGGAFYAGGSRLTDMFVFLSLFCYAFCVSRSLVRSLGG